MNSADFEQHLKQLRPANSNDRLADTFYQSGWQACEKSHLLLAAKRTSNRAVPTFASGLVCGIIFSIGAFLVSPNAEDPVGVNVAQQPTERAVEPAGGIGVNQKNAVDSVVVSNSLPSSIVERWKIDDLFVVSPLAMEKPSPLSRVAQQGWSSQMRASADLTRRSSLAAVTAQDSAEEGLVPSPLTTSPFNRSMLDELML